MRESDIQKFLWENRGRWEELIEDVPLPEKYPFLENKDQIWERSPEKVLHNILVKKLHQAHQELRELKLLGYEVPLKKEGSSTIRADFLGIINNVPGISIIELKKSRQTERQAFTELLGYSSHLRSLFPAMSDDDIHYVLISPMEERIVREACLLRFLTNSKPVYAFIPTYKNDNINTIRLEPWIPEIQDVFNINKATFSDKNIEIYRLSWDSIEDWNPIRGENPTEYMVSRMNLISAHAAQLMEAKGINGFVFASQAHPELHVKQNTIIIAGLNPFKISIDNYLLKKHDIEQNEVDTIDHSQVTMLDIINGLEKKSREENEKFDYLENLTTNWKKNIQDIAIDVVTTMTKSRAGNEVSLEGTSITWREFKENVIENGLSFQHAIKPTGLLRMLYIEYSVEDYEYLNKYSYEEHPYLDHGDISHYLVDYYDNDNNFLHFVYSLFDKERDIFSLLRRGLLDGL